MVASSNRNELSRRERLPAWGALLSRTAVCGMPRSSSTQLLPLPELLLLRHLVILVVVTMLQYGHLFTDQIGGV